MNKIYKIHLCSMGKGTGQYNEIYNGLKINNDVIITENINEADYIIYNSCDKNFDYFMKIKPNKFKNFNKNCQKYQDYINIYKNYNHPEKEIILDWTDFAKYKLCASTEQFKTVFLYFKRMCVERKKNKSKKFITYERKVIPLPFAIRQDTINYINSIKNKFNREFDISCMFGKGNRGRRRDIYKFFKNTEFSRKYKVFVGTIKKSKKFYHQINNGYINQLLKSKIIVTSNPKNHEGDYRLFEALSSGALVFSDQMLTPVKNPLINKKHLIYYKNINHLNELLIYYLNNDKERNEIAKNGHQYALKYHTFIYRTKEIIDEIKNKQSIKI